MEKKKLLEPSFWVSALNCILLIVLISSNWNGVESVSKNPSSESSGTPKTATETEEFDEALDLCDSYQKSGDYDSAYDMLMVASRIAPSDPRLFDHAMAFIEAAMESDDERNLILAEDILSRGDSLVHFQNPENVQSARKRLTEIRVSFAKDETLPQQVAPFDSLKALLKVAENTSVPVSVRTQATEELRNGVKSALLEEAVISDGKDSDNSNKSELQEIQSKLEAAEKECIQILFVTIKSKSSNWIEKSKSLLSKKDISSEQVPDYVKEIDDMLKSGYSLLSEIQPYAGADVTGAAKDEFVLGAQIRMLERQKTWIYNQQVLRLIREIESKDWMPEDKISHLAEIREERLAPYVLRRHNVVWDNVFEKLPDDNAKILAVKLRVLGRKAFANEE